MKIGIIVNPLSSQNPLKKTQSLIKALRGEHIPYQLHILPKEGLDEKTLNLLRNVVTLIVIGGDGTLGRVVDTIVRKDLGHIVLGTLPAGTGNDMAANLGTTTIPSLLEALMKGSKVSLDVFFTKVTLRDGTQIGRHFIVNLLIGHFGLALRKTSMFLKRSFGRDAYTIGVLLAILYYNNFYSQIFCEKECVYQGKNLAIVAGNLATTAGGVHLVPHASPTDRKIDLLVAANLSRLETLRALPVVLREEHLRLPPVRYYKGEEITMCLKYPPIGIDGEYIGKVQRVEITYATTLSFFQVDHANQLR